MCCSVLLCVAACPIDVRCCASCCGSLACPVDGSCVAGVLQHVPYMFTVCCSMSRRCSLLCVILLLACMPRRCLCVAGVLQCVAACPIYVYRCAAVCCSLLQHVPWTFVCVQQRTSVQHNKYQQRASMYSNKCEYAASGLSWSLFNTLQHTATHCNTL